MRADRLLSALLLLQAHGKLSGRELATRLEVSPRTAHRDMEARGGWQLDEQWRSHEKRAQLDLVEPRHIRGVIGDPRLAAAAERALQKLMAALPLSLRERAASMRQRLHVDMTGWRNTAESFPALQTVQDAVSRDRKLAIRYLRAGRERVERTVDPLGLVAKGTTWYLVAQTPKGLRTYRVSRIEEANLLDAPSERPANFDLAAYWKSSTEQFKESRPCYHATLRLAPRAAEGVKAWRNVQAEEAPDAEGWITLRVQFEDEDQACFVALGLGPRVDVIDPPNLRQRVAADVAAVVERTRTIAPESHS